ncbi:cupin domain-containing protein [Pontibacter sp. E15-1]|uniref:cupin domain-containing protein n=1 Tax=Pontibacter sp. E15-1 TaxID=2919918 RepID=UPI001F4FFA86|nr:cupin domain-containing protein [Pontibacter sp. E15-1]MCJ8163395.1 cupin domain-containing protein [Pontibacter sp. E15-1]
MKTTIEPRFVLGHKVCLIHTPGDFDMALVHTMPNVKGPPPHYHNHLAELFYAVKGQLEVMVEGEWHTLSQGDSLVVPSGKVHTFRNSGPEEAEWLTTWSPKGFGRFFDAFGVPTSRKHAFEASTAPKLVERFRQQAIDYDMIITQEE